VLDATGDVVRTFGVPLSKSNLYKTMRPAESLDVLASNRIVLGATVLPVALIRATGGVPVAAVALVPDIAAPRAQTTATVARTRAIRQRGG
jgi:hypothetical protein